MRHIPDFKSRIQKLKKIRKKLLSIAENSTPLYVYDSEEAKLNLRRFSQAFSKAGERVSIYYAAKSNHYLGLLKTVVKEGYGIDVSSERELALALKAGAKKIVYSGPVKTKASFKKILASKADTLIHLESIREIHELAEAASGQVKCGVRIFGSAQSKWSKFGVPLTELSSFIDAISTCKNLKFSAIQFHISYNTTARPYVETFRELGDYLKKNISLDIREKVEFLDMGGGIVPDAFEAGYPWNPDFDIRYKHPTKYPTMLLNDEVKPRTYPYITKPIEKIANEIVRAFRKFIKPVLPNAALIAEPGRFISHSVMHILLRVIDLKCDRQMLITDGGTNMIGWEKFQWVDYAPVFNLSNFSAKKEFPFLLYGSLCTIDDIWGYYVYASKLEERNVLVIPYQGAYTYSTAQEFIRDIPKVVDI